MPTRIPRARWTVAPAGELPFGLTLDGTPDAGRGQLRRRTDPTNGRYSCPNEMHQRVDRIPFEAIIGWDATGNGNLAQMLQEPTLMGAYEGAGITVLGRGVRIPANSTDFCGVNATGGAGGSPTARLADEQQRRLHGAHHEHRQRSRLRHQQLPLQPVAHRRRVRPQQLAGRGAMSSSTAGATTSRSPTRASRGNHGTLTGGHHLGTGESRTPSSTAASCRVFPVVMSVPADRHAYGHIATDRDESRSGSTRRCASTTTWSTQFVGRRRAVLGHALGGRGRSLQRRIGRVRDRPQLGRRQPSSTGDGGGLAAPRLDLQWQDQEQLDPLQPEPEPTLPTNGGGVGSSARRRTVTAGSTDRSAAAPTTRTARRGCPRAPAEPGHRRQPASWVTAPRAAPAAALRLQR